MAESIAPVQSYGIDLLYESSPGFTPAALLEQLAQCGNVEPAEPDEGGALAFRFPDLVPPDEPGARPVHYNIQLGGPLPGAESEDALLQTRDWRDARAVVARHKVRLSVSDRHASGIPYKNRLRLFQDVLRALVQVAAPLAIHWRPSTKIVSPLLLAKAAEPGKKPDPLLAAINVRCQPSSDGKGGQVMDTLGLVPLGLPDLEVAFRDRDPAKMEPFLRALARYIYDLGDVIPDGRVLKGSQPGEKWQCFRGRASEEPPRDVIQLKPAPPA